jgi:hypothetical protein
VICSYKTSGKIKNIFKILTWLYVIILFLCILIPTVFKTQFQQGKIFPGLGKALMFISPPEDSYIPLCSEEIIKNKTKYEFNFKHKYVGNHTIDISFLKHPDLKNFSYKIHNFSITVIVLQDGNQIFKKFSNEFGRYYNDKNCVFTLINYQVPDDLPINTKLTVNILFDGNLDQMIDKYGRAHLLIRKGSDE